jgi:hypothetical protein
MCRSEMPRRFDFLIHCWAFLNKHHALIWTAGCSCILFIAMVRSFLANPARAIQTILVSVIAIAFALWLLMHYCGEAMEIMAGSKIRVETRGVQGVVH